MRKELEQRLVERYPTWFNTTGDIRHTLMPRGFTHDDGWFDILWRLCGDLEPLVAQFEKETGLHFEVLQVKEKFGGLRFYGPINSIRKKMKMDTLIRLRASTRIRSSKFPRLFSLNVITQQRSK